MWLAGVAGNNHSKLEAVDGVTVSLCCGTKLIGPANNRMDKNETIEP